MATVTILWSLCAGVAIMLAGASGLVWLIDRRNLASLVLCILGLAAAAGAYGELGMMHSATAAEFAEWQHWYFVPVSITLIGQVLFVHFYLGTGRSWLMWTVVLARSVALVVNLSVHPSFNFLNIVSLRHVSLFGEKLSVIDAAVVRPGWQWFAVASLILLMAYLVDAAARRWLKGGKYSRRKALAVSLGIAVPMLCNIVYAQLLVFGILHGPLSNVPWFLGAFLTMAYELGRDVVVSRRARLELAELRTQLALSERVSVLGQLAPMLAHELSQPLAASLVNVEAARKILEDPRPNLEKLRGILGDIGRDDSRAAEIIDRMRRLLKRHTIEMRPLSVEDLLHDVVSLVDPEAASKQVELDLNIEPELPRVFGDRVHLSQVLLNLITNGVQAVQSRPLDARHIVVEARAHDAKGEVEIAVRDSGPGVQDVDEVFRPFFTTKPGGAGLGLALARTIVEAHGGNLWIDNTTRQGGAVFRFTLPPV